MAIITVTEEENDKLRRLYKTAQSTPVIRFSTNPEEKDLATMAWDDVRNYMDELGRKYGYDPEKHAVNPKTGEVVEYNR